MARGRPDFTYLADTDIIAQTIGNLAVNIAAQTLTALGINIKAQDLAQLIISIAAQTIGVYLQPEWAAKTGIDKDFHADADNVASGSGISLNYTVPAGKTLYITHVTGVCRAYDLANGDLNQIGYIDLREATVPRKLISLGGNGGAGISLAKPIVFTQNQQLFCFMINVSNHSCTLRVDCGGYEV